jgi:hypothetical protein
MCKLQKPMFHKRRLAARLWPKYSLYLDMVNQNARLHQWHETHLRGPHLSTRMDLHRHVYDQQAGKLDYLEFGVYKGRTLRAWSEMSRRREVRLFGFDTFTGLPEKWELGGASLAEGHFAVEAMPTFDDPRVTLVKGLFQDTLPLFLNRYERRGTLIVHLDADLYSSTLYVLARLSDVLRAGDVLIFDEFSQPLHEYRALVDWSQAYRRSYVGIASASEYHQQVAVRLE